MKLITFTIFIIALISCKKEIEIEPISSKILKSDTVQILKDAKIGNNDTVILSLKHKINRLLCDLDGDKLNETVEIIRSTKSGKSGLRITFGNGKRNDYFGMGNKVLEQGFDEIDWVGIFEKAPKNELYWSNVDENGEILGDDQIDELDKIKLLNDGIFIHAVESCGGGIIYLDNGKYKWIQQE